MVIHRNTFILRNGKTKATIYYLYYSKIVKYSILDPFQIIIAKLANLSENSSELHVPGIFLSR